MTRIAGLDPGKHLDAFAFVGTEVTEGVMRVKGAKRWMGRNYLQVEDELAGIHAKSPFDMYVLELNNTGTHVYEVLVDQKHLPVIPVVTTKDVKDLAKKHDGRTMDKNEMVRLMAHWFLDGSIVFPVNKTPELMELERQLKIFAEHKTETGSVSYRAEGSEHDDLVMALMLACFGARNIIGAGRLQIHSVNNEVIPIPESTRELVWTEEGFRYR